MVTVAPTVSISGPIDGASFSITAPITLTANVNAGTYAISNVSYYVNNGTLLGAATGAPSWSSLLHFRIDPDCYPMDLDLPSAQRNTVVVSADGATLDYFEVQATLVEQNNPGGE